MKFNILIRFDKLGYLAPLLFLLNIFFKLIIQQLF